MDTLVTQWIIIYIIDTYNICINLQSAFQDMMRKIKCSKNIINKINTYYYPAHRIYLFVS